MVALSRKLVTLLLVGVAVGATKLTFLKYKPSEFEVEFKALVERINPTDGCASWSKGTELYNLAMKSMHEKLYEQHSKLVFENHHGEMVESLIEPLTSFLRYPLALMPGNENRQSIMRKDHYLFPPRNNLVSESGQLKRIFFFDLGASLYSSAGAGGDNGASLEWFFDKYGNLTGSHDPFFAIYAWEREQYKQKKLWSTMPDHLIPRMHYYNVAVDAKLGAKMNVWRFLPLVTQPHDHVVVKLDIDHQATELTLIAQLLDSSTGYANYIDEFFFEHHVAGSALQCPKLWGKRRGGWKEMQFDLTKGSNETLAESYELFTNLRKMGIRAHSWV